MIVERFVQVYRPAKCTYSIRIPANIRREFGIDSNTKVAVILKDDMIVIKKEDTNESK